ncbi:esterase/lipase family protein, partial [Priestia filamentosa]|uniref:esterase/lipase family protein n=1 Tax=Priestia filamentosa TaxID=1402861 RepID=UPI003982A3E2
TNEEGVNNKLFDDRFEYRKELTIDNNKVVITRDSIENTFLNNLPHTLNTEIFLVNLEKLDTNISFDLLCKEDEYFFVIEEHYFKIWNELNRLSNSENVNDWLINWDYNEQDSNVERAKAKLFSEFHSKIQILKHLDQGNERLKARLTNRQLTSLLSYSDKEIKLLDSTMQEIHQLRFLYLVNHKHNLNNNRFYIVKGCFDRNNENDDMMTLGEKKNKEKNYKLGMFGKSENKDAVDKPIVIVVHGIGSSCRLNNSDIYPDLVSFLVPNFHVFTYDYLTINQTINDSGAMLAKDINDLKKQYHGKEVIVIAHSMGGLVSRAALVKHNASIDYLIMAGTPNNGSRLGSMTDITRKVLLKTNKKRLKSQDAEDLFHRRIKGLEDLGNKTTYIKSLNAEDSSNENKYYCIVGNYLGLRNDIIVSNFNMIRINRNELPQFHRANLNHMNYFSANNIEKSIGKALQNIKIRKLV